MDGDLRLASATASLRRGIDFLRKQIAPGGRVGAGPGEPPDPWSTAQVACALADTDGGWEPLASVAQWLVSCQLRDGGWASPTFGGLGDTPSTAFAVLALRSVAPQDPEIRAAISRGVEWLVRSFSYGWITIPSHPTSAPPHIYSTAMALRALAGAAREPLISERVQEGLDALCRAHQSQQGWGYTPQTASDPTFTTYALHGILDLEAWGVKPNASIVRDSLNWLVRQQNAQGSWREWHGLDSSPEAAAYVTYVLLRAKYSPGAPVIRRAIDWLIDQQRSTGAWCHAGNESNWVTHSAVIALQSFLTSTRASASPTPPWANASDCYREVLPHSWDVTPYCRPLDHTMAYALDEYVHRKLPAESLKLHIGAGGIVEIHGVFPPEFPFVSRELGLQITAAIPHGGSGRKAFNSIRPTFYFCKREQQAAPVLAVAVTPGKDYVAHYASMVRHLLRALTVHADEIIHVYHYPQAEDELPRRTGLDESYVRPGDIVLLGYVPFLKRQLDNSRLAMTSSARRSDYLGAFRYVTEAGENIVLLGVKYSYWGSISEVLVRDICLLGAKEIIYVAKLGALSDPEHLYSRVFVPSSYTTLHHHQVVHSVAPPPKNGVLSAFPELDTGCHISVPTVLEEDYLQRETASRLRASSIDNEISQMARAVTDVNRKQARDISFSAVHFATDYIRQPTERGLIVGFDLSTNRTEQARRAKRRVLRKIWDLHLAPYLLERGS